MTLSEAIEFAARFRVLEREMIQTKRFVLNVMEKVFPSGKIHFGYLFHGVTDFFEKKRLRSSYFQTFPFFEDQRMYVQTLLSIKADMELTEVDVYRTSSLSG